MTLTDILIAEHHHIERLIRLLGVVTDRFNQGHPVQPAVFIEAAQFIQVYADGFHHRKEEGILFPVIAPSMAKAVEALLGEHEIARGFTRGMREAALAWQKGDEAAAQETVKNARNYAALLHDHILHENGVVFPATNWLIPSTEQARMLELCSRLEHDSADPQPVLSWLDALETQTSA